MFTKEQVKVDKKNSGVYCHFERPGTQYGQFYYTTPGIFDHNLVKNENEAKDRFVAFYNQFE